MGAHDDLRINTLHRFAKHSPRLTLREYSHCEVPAGCGGVVLRWTDPTDARAVFVHLGTPNAEVDAWLDGTEIVASAHALAGDEHVLALHVTRHAKTPTGRLLVAPSVSIEPGSANLLPRSLVARATTTIEPDIARADLDDRHWPLAERATPRDIVGLTAWRRRYQQLLDEGALVLVADDEIWMRLHFRLEGSAR